MSKKLFLLAAVCLAFCPVVVSAQITVDFSQESGLSDFQGLTAGDQVLLDGAGGYNAGGSRYGFDFDSKFTLVDAEYATLGGTFDAPNLNTGASGLGVAADGNAGKPTFDANNDFGDAITFNLSVEDFVGGSIVLDKFVFSDLSDNEFFTLQSEGFKGKGYSGNGDDIQYDESSGTFKFLGDTGGDGEYRLTEDSNLDWFDSTEAVYISESDNLTLAFGWVDPQGTGDSPNAAFLKSFTFHAVPEPASMGLLAASGIGFVVYRRRKKKLNTKASA